MAAAEGFAALQLMQGMNQANAVRKQSRLNKDIAEMNAEALEYDAYEAEKYGYSQSARYASVVNGIIGDQNLAYAVNNIDVTSGTAAEVIQESRVVGFLNTLDIQREARNKAKGLKMQAISTRLGGGYQYMQGNAQAGNIMTSAIFNAGATLVNAQNDKTKASLRRNSGYSYAEPSEE